MDVSCQSFLSSPPFSIKGPDGTTFYAHGDLLAQSSNVLAVEVNGAMREAETRVIHIENVDNDLDDETVMRFLEFAYRGDYTVPPPDIVILSNDVGDFAEANRAKSSESANNESFPADNDHPASFDPYVSDAFADWEKSAAKETKRCSRKKAKFSNNDWYDVPKETEMKDPHPSKREQLWSKFCDQALVRQGATWEPKPNSDPCEDHSRVYVNHARLYVFSNRYECNALRDLCLQKLRLTLSRHKLHQSRRSDVTKLVRYSYDHTPDFHEGSDKLRNLISDYVVCHIEQMCHEREFLDLLQACDGLARDLMVKLMQRLED